MKIANPELLALIQKRKDVQMQMRELKKQQKQQQMELIKDLPYKQLRRGYDDIQKKCNERYMYRKVMTKYRQTLVNSETQTDYVVELNVKPNVN